MLSQVSIRMPHEQGILHARIYAPRAKNCQYMYAVVMGSDLDDHYQATAQKALVPHNIIIRQYRTGYCQFCSVIFSSSVSSI